MSELGRQTGKGLFANTVLRNRLLATAGAVLTAAALAACDGSSESSNTGAQSSAAASASPSAAPKESAAAQPPEKVEWNLDWEEVDNPDLVAEMRRSEARGECKTLPGTKGADPENQATWREVYLGVPVKEVKNEPVLNLAYWTKGDGDTVGYGVFDEKPQEAVAKNGTGSGYEVVAAAVGPEATRFCFVSGDIDATRLADGPSWAVENTQVISSATLRNPEQIPHV